MCKEDEIPVEKGPAAKALVWVKVAAGVVAIFLSLWQGWEARQEAKANRKAAAEAVARAKDVNNANATSIEKVVQDLYGEVWYLKGHLGLTGGPTSASIGLGDPGTIGRGGGGVGGLVASEVAAIMDEPEELADERPARVARRRRPASAPRRRPTRKPDAGVPDVGKPDMPKPKKLPPPVKFQLKRMVQEQVQGQESL